MISLYNNKRFKTLIPVEEIESGALDQIKNCLSHDFVKKLAIMPDIHQGYSLPIGAVALLDNIISPDYVGFDIGCGVVYYDTKIPVKELLIDERQKRFIYNKILEQIPVGFNLNKHGCTYPSFKSSIGNKDLDKKVNEKLFKSLGTLGGGNHYIEVGQTRQGNLAITIHSGSRNPGHSVAGFYMEKSKTEDTDLPNGFLHITSDYGKAYIMDMNFMLYYALENRRRMLFKILDVLGIDYLRKDFEFVNENHNHAIITKEGILHRKGATSADKDQIGIIPGNMRDGVYITKGLGNNEFLCSASHGAGRKGSRNWAKKTFNVDDFKKEMNGIVANVTEKTLDESPFAYKNINDVIWYQEGKVINVIDHVKPLINIKG